MLVNPRGCTHTLPYIDNKNKFYIIILVQRTCHGKQKRKLKRRKDTGKEKTLAKRKQKQKYNLRNKKIFLPKAVDKNKNLVDNISD